MNGLAVRNILRWQYIDEPFLAKDGQRKIALGIEIYQKNSFAHVTERIRNVPANRGFANSSLIPTALNPDLCPISCSN
jgi:hypothetical protein